MKLRKQDGEFVNALINGMGTGVLKLEIITSPIGLKVGVASSQKGVDKLKAEGATDDCIEQCRNVMEMAAAEIGEIIKSCGVGELMYESTKKDEEQPVTA